MKLDRDLQLELLNKFEPHYPIPQPLGAWERRSEVEANLYYLIEHDLIEAKILRTTTGIQFGNIKLTKGGMDFLAGDGGLSAILGVVTIKLHDETVRNLVETRIRDADIPPAEKTGLLAQLRSLGGESVKHLTMKLLDAGVDNLPEVIRAIQTSL